MSLGLSVVALWWLSRSMLGKSDGGGVLVCAGQE